MSNLFKKTKIDHLQSLNCISLIALFVYANTFLYPANSIAQGTGCIYPDGLEITSINIGQGDATLVATPTKLMLIDAGETYWNSNRDALKVDDVIKQKYGKRNRVF